MKRCRVFSWLALLKEAERNPINTVTNILAMVPVTFVDVVLSIYRLRLIR